ncbi:DMT family transporter [Streptomyces varsoviensis]|uniref:DMT family transporter n=1 Tax=Streptomyces varsoviensis TaxID=67373 RepID=UPI0033F7E1C0
MSPLVLSVLLCVVSAVCYAAGAIVQERVAATGPHGTYAPLAQPRWWGAVVLTGAGAGLHVAALAYGPLSLVQPLGALTIVFALPMGALVVRRRVAAAGWRGAILASAGLAGLMSLTGEARPGESLNTSERPVLAVGALVAAALLVLGARWVRRPVVRGVALAVAAGAVFGMASVFTKTVAEGWADGEALAVLAPSMAAVAVLAVSGLLLSQASYRGAGLAAPLATATVVNPAVAAAVGIAAMGERFRYGLPGELLALVAAAVAAVGVVMLTVEGSKHEPQEQEQEQERETDGPRGPRGPGGTRSTTPLPRPARELSPNPAAAAPAAAPEPSLERRSRLRLPRGERFGAFRGAADEDGTGRRLVTAGAKSTAK